MLERRLQSRYAVSVIMRGKKQPASTMRYVLGPSSLAIFDTERRSWRPSCTARVQKEYLSQLPVFSGVPCLWISVTLTFSFLVFAVTIQYYAGPNTAQYPNTITSFFNFCRFMHNMSVFFLNYYCTLYYSFQLISQLKINFLISK